MSDDSEKGHDIMKPVLTGAGILGLVVTLVSQPSAQTITAAAGVAAIAITWGVKWLMHRRDKDEQHELTAMEQMERLVKRMQRNEERTDQLRLAVIRALRVIGRFSACRNGADCPVIKDYGDELDMDVAEIEATLDLRYERLPDIEKVGSKALWDAIKAAPVRRTQQPEKA